MLVRQTQHALYSWQVVSCISLVILFVIHGCTIDGALAGELHASDETANNNTGVQRADPASAGANEVVRWVKEHHVFDARFFETSPGKAKPTAWDDALEKNITRLGIANLWDGGIRDDDLRYLSECPDIFVIALNTDTTKLSGTGLERHLKEAMKLQSVYFSGSQPVPAEWVKGLASLDRIQTWVFRAPVTDEGLAALQSSKDTIERLLIFAPERLTEKGYHAIGDLESLKWLVVMYLKEEKGDVGVHLNEEEIHAMSRCAQLRDLYIFIDPGGVELSVQAARDLASMPGLQCMTMSCVSAPTEEALAVLGQRKWISIGLQWPALAREAKQQGKSPLVVSQKIIEEAAARLSTGAEDRTSGEDTGGGFGGGGKGDITGGRKRGGRKRGHH